ncbi:site-specific integrase [Nocardioides sp. W3-2-3]|uniref:hypothetical protein n=1 Tax=Nocardioides convexus TaxID=2712224 RepID=UPI00241867CE|nr:hypothetical protein [Nocardioides convexus]NHA02060.1 site-specific integrase [Nocardioides convexus]
MRERADAEEHHQAPANGASCRRHPGHDQPRGPRGLVGRPAAPQGLLARQRASPSCAAFYTWCQVWERRTDNPTVRISTPKAGAGAPRPVTRREWDLIIAHVKDDGPMRRAMYLAVWAGLRREEAARLSLVRHRPRHPGRARPWEGPQDPAREVLHPPDRGACCPTTAATSSPALSKPGRPTRSAGRSTPPSVPPASMRRTTSLRHRYGSLAYQRTKDPKALAGLMGHASVATTMSFYAAAADDAADAIADAVVDE